MDRLNRARLPTSDAARSLFSSRIVFNQHIAMPNWITVAQVADCPPGSGCELVAGDRIVALFNVDGALYALDGVCPHQGGPLGKGCLTGTVVTCPWHGWQFDVRDGQHQLSKSFRQPRFDVRREGDDVQVDLDSSR
jgi:nitrite reductase (NADH) small subunit